MGWVSVVCSLVSFFFDLRGYVELGLEWSFLNLEFFGWVRWRGGFVYMFRISFREEWFCFIFKSFLL